MFSFLFLIHWAWHMLCYVSLCVCVCVCVCAHACVCRCVRKNSLNRCGCSRLARLHWHGTSPYLCSFLSQRAAILCKHSTIPAMLPHYVPVETYSPPFADQWMLQHTSWRWEHNEMSRWYILNSVRVQGLLGSMDNKPCFFFFFLKQNHSFISCLLWFITVHQLLQQ